MATDTNELQRLDRGEVPLARKVDRMGMLIHRYYEAKAHDHGGMGDPLRGQGRVLALLKVKPETTQRELSFLLDMRQQSLSELLSKLEEKGFITREKSETDGRVTVVRLTEAGSAAAPSTEQMQENADALDCLDEDEQAQLDALTTKVTESLEGKLAEMGIDPQQGPRRHGPHHGRDGHGERPGHDGDGRGGRGAHGGRGGRGSYGGRGGEDRGGYGGRGGRDERGGRSGYGGRGERDDHGNRGGHGGPKGNRHEYGHGGSHEEHRGPYRPKGDSGRFNTYEA